MIRGKNRENSVDKEIPKDKFMRNGVRRKAQEKRTKQSERRERSRRRRRKQK